MAGFAFDLVRKIEESPNMTPLKRLASAAIFAGATSLGLTTVVLTTGALAQGPGIAPNSSNLPPTYDYHGYGYDGGPGYGYGGYGYSGNGYGYGDSYPNYGYAPRYYGYAPGATGLYDYAPGYTYGYVTPRPYLHYRVWRY
jgi:hypothetical protein